MEESIQVSIILDQERMMQELTVDQFILIQEGNIKVIRDVLALFAYDADGNRIPQAEAVKLLGGLKIAELMKLAQDFGKKAEETAVPPGNGAA